MKLNDIINKWSIHFALEPNLLDLRKQLRNDINSYAVSVANKALKTASENAKVQYFVIGKKTDVSELTARIDKQSILNTPINVDDL